MATLTVLNVSRADRGNFQIAAKNSQGLDEAEIRIDVIGPPSKPIGPLNIRYLRAWLYGLIYVRYRGTVL